VKLYLFLDEIHTIPGWEKWVRRISEREKDIKLVITAMTLSEKTEKLSKSNRSGTGCYNNLIKVFGLLDYFLLFVESCFNGFLSVF